MAKSHMMRLFYKVVKMSLYRNIPTLSTLVVSQCLSNAGVVAWCFDKAKLCKLLSVI